MVISKITSEYFRNGQEENAHQTDKAVMANHRSKPYPRIKTKNRTSDVSPSRLRGGMQCPFMPHFQPNPAMASSSQGPFSYTGCPALMYGPNTCGATPVVLFTLPHSTPPSTQPPPTPALVTPNVSTLRAQPLPTSGVSPSGLSEKPVDVDQVSVRVKITPPTPISAQGGRSQVAQKVSPGLAPQSVATSGRSSPRATSARQAVPSKRPPSVISDSLFENPPFHSSAIQQAPKPPSFRSLNESSGNEGAPMISYDSSFLDSQWSKYGIDSLRQDPNLNYDALNETEKKLYHLDQDMKKNKNAILTNVFAAKKLREEMAQAAEENPENVLRYRQYKKNIIDLGREARRLLLEVRKFSGRPADVPPEVPPPTPNQDVDMVVEIFPSRLDTSAVRLFLRVADPATKSLLCPPHGLPSAVIPSPDTFYGKDYEALVDEGLAPNTAPARKHFETQKKHFGDFKRSFDRAKEIEHQVDPILQNPNWQQDEKEKETMRNLLDSYFQHRRNLVNYYFMPD